MHPTENKVEHYLILVDGLFALRALGPLTVDAEGEIAGVHAVLWDTMTDVEQAKVERGIDVIKEKWNANSEEDGGDAGFSELQWRVEGLTPSGLRVVARFAVEPDAWKYGSGLLMARLYCGGEFRGEYRGSALPDGRSGGGTWYINKSDEAEAAPADLEWQVWGMSIAGWVILAKFAVEPDALKYAESLLRARMYRGTEFRAEWKGEMRGHPKATWYDTKQEDYEAELESKA